MQQGLRRNLILITYAILLFLGVANWGFVWGAISKVFGLTAPFFYGFVIAYLLNGPYLFFRDRVYGGKNRERRKMPPRAAKILALVTAYLLAILCLTLVVWIIVPQLGESIRKLSDNFAGYLASLTAVLEDTMAKWGGRMELVEQIKAGVNHFIENINFDSISRALNAVFPHLVNFTKGVTTGLYHWLIGLIVSIYMLVGREKLIRQIKKLVNACVPKRFLGKVWELATLTNQTFGKFIIGRLIDSFIILVLCFIGMTIFQMPYALLISVIVGVTNVIPILGPFIGGIPSAFILLMVDPIKGLWFIVFIIVLQQIDGNIIDPHVVGNSIGLSGIWVMFGVIVGGGQFGMLGMLLGVPVLAVVYTVLGDWVNKRLKKETEEPLTEPAYPEKDEPVQKEEVLEMEDKDE